MRTFCMRTSAASFGSPGLEDMLSRFMLRNAFAGTAPLRHHVCNGNKQGFTRIRETRALREGFLRASAHQASRALGAHTHVTWLIGLGFCPADQLRINRSRISSMGCRLLLLACGIVTAHAIALTRDENLAVLQAAQNEPDAAFHAWALRHSRPYASMSAPQLNAVQAQLGAQEGMFPSLVHASPPQLMTVLLDHLQHRLRPDATQLDKVLHTALDQVAMTQLHKKLLEYSSRKQVWLSNLQYASAYNQEHPSAGHWLGLTALADLSFEEYTMLLGTRPAVRGGDSLKRSEEHVSQQLDMQLEEQLQAGSDGRVPGFMYSQVDLASLPHELDWRNFSAVTGVKNQGMCGSCWAFATTGAIEGINALYTHKLVSLSEQELVDCDRDVDMGCSGGMMDNAYNWIMTNGGLHTERDWPYTAQEAFEGCTLQQHQGGRIVTIDGFQDGPPNDEAALLKAAAHQPVAVAVEADSRPFQLYMGGVMSDPGCGTQLNHGVLVVGYGGLDSGHIPSPGQVPADPGHGPYWLVKNSWGPEWGAGGYIKIQMGYRDNSTGMQGLCGITLAASFPIKTSPNPKPTPKPSPSPPPPPSPPPGPSTPVHCDSTYSCPPQSTCCCMDEPTSVLMPGRASEVKTGCSSWGCCPMASATCCEDRLHCCPAELPVCDTEGGRCLPKSKAAHIFQISWLRSTPATRQGETPEEENEALVARRRSVRRAAPQKAVR